MDDVLSPDRYPGPLCRYRIDGEPRVEAVNDRFESRFEPVSPGTPLEQTFDRLGIEPRTGTASVAARLGEQRPFVVEVPDGETGCYTVQPVESDDGGWLLFVGSTETDLPSLGLDHVASVVSHDLRNPLDVAKARLEAGRELGEDEHFEHVARAHDRMERIIQDVLTLARGEAVVSPEEVVDLEEVARAAWVTVETPTAELSMAGSLPTTTADSDRVGRLFENMFRNATEHSAGNVTVTVGRLDDGFYVEDDGPGIPTADHERVLEPGFSSDDRGTGLGLAIVARIVDLHDWSITVTDADSGGARFEITGLE
jgi:nitrogen-specific signal transduction histidine kinase